MALEFKRGGRKVSLESFAEGIVEAAREKAVRAYADRLHARAASIVDPETGKHAPVFTRIIAGETVSIHTAGSKAFARTLEKRLGLTTGEVRGMHESSTRKRKVYLAHAWEDKGIAKPIAEGLMANGIETWYDNWEIQWGDSLRQKMEQGLGACTHFVVLLTQTSIKKAWVNEEIDAGLIRQVEGAAKFIGLRHELPLSDLSAFLKSRLTPEYVPNAAGLEALVSQILGVSSKPPLGEKPKYVRTNEIGSSWSTAARAVAEYFVRASANGSWGDPQTEYEDLQRVTGLPMPDVRIGVLDLKGAGLLEKKQYLGGRAHLLPTCDLFAVFDGLFMDWEPEADAREIATFLSNLNTGQVASGEVATQLGWKARRFNSAAAYLISARIVEGIGARPVEGYSPSRLVFGDELLRFVRSL